MNQEQWFLKREVKDIKEKVALFRAMPEFSSVSDFAIRHLINKGYDTKEKMYHFLYFKEYDIPDIHKAKDVDKFIERLRQAVVNQEEITLIADYDADGVCSAAIFIYALRLQGIQANYFVSNRFSEGYGISKKSVTRLFEEYPNTKLIVTTDNGIVGFEGVELANQKGCDVIISDHHEPRKDGSLPAAHAIVDLKRLDDEYPFKELCGAALIYRLMCEFYKANGLNAASLKILLAYVACATIGDVVSLTEENRFYVKEGIKEIEKGTLQCFNSLNLLCARKDGDSASKKITEETLGFTYAPILNAMGRVTGDVIPCIDFLLETDEEKSLEMGKGIVAINEQRKNLCKNEDKLAAPEVEAHSDDAFIIAMHPDFHEGIIGITAGHIKEKYQKPCIVFTKTEDDDDVFKGSARSMPGFNMEEALNRIADLLLGYGGHAMAAGLSVKKENLEKVRKALCDLAEDETFYKKEIGKVYIDYALRTEDINAMFIAAIDTELRPFGTDFEKPVFGMRGFNAISCVGMPKAAPENERKHLKLVGPNNFSILWWGGYQQWKEMGEPLQVKVIGSPGMQLYQGKKNFSLTIQGDRLQTES